MDERIMLMYPPGPIYQRGEDRSQGNIEDSTATSMRACNDLGYCAAVLARENYSVFLMDYQTENKTIFDLEVDLDRFMPKMVLISVTNATIFEDIKIANHIKELSGAYIVLKGAIFFDPDEELLSLLDLKFVDYLIGGEAETCIVGIADHALRHMGDINSIHNILIKDRNCHFVATKFYCWVDALDSIPFPARRYMNNRIYVRPDTQAPMATIQTSRGCSASCIYCLSPKISGKKVRLRSPENVMLEIEECYHKFGIKNFFFKADTFTMNPGWTKKLCALIISSSLYNKIEFTANSRTNPLSFDVLQAMKDAGCFSVAFGFESGSDETLKRIKKGSDVAHNIQAAKWAHKLNLKMYGFFMAGFPWETREHLEQTRKHIFDIDADFIEVHLVLPYYGTELYNICHKSGVIENGPLGNDYFHTNVTGTEFLAQKELVEFRNKIIHDYYIRPGYIIKRLKECLYKPRILPSYIRYGMKIIFGRDKG
ncbi:MAG: B12-binding domain-containing radical SAM protein [Tannerellaceae bacterium]|jgi:radical SAM superfamily enzyme YgiQ (UPF0313 family)|nr:B12-binding domain-containing radical SAM protein [Tannerellaceae bacterium]